jgi:uncharacterized phage protein (TIGR02218 family)
MSVLPYAHFIRINDLGFTSFDCDVTIDGIVYYASGAIDPTAVTQDSESGAGNFEVKGFLATDLISDIDIRLGKFTDADVEIFVGNWITKQKVRTLAKGRWGEVVQDGLTWRMTVQTNADRLNDTVHNVIQPNCRWTGRLDNPRCGKNKYDFGHLGTITTVSSPKQFVITETINNPHIFNWSSGSGYIEVNTGANAGFEFEIDSVSGSTVTIRKNPPYAFEVGDEIQLVPGCDGSFWTCQTIFGNEQKWGGFPTDGNFFPTATDLRK